METLTMQQIREYVIAHYETVSPHWREQVDAHDDKWVMKVYNRIQELVGNPLNGVRPPEDTRILQIVNGTWKED